MTPSVHEDAADAAAATMSALEALERAGFLVAVGGSLALGAWGWPRGTTDGDLNVFAADPSRYPAIVAALEAAGFAPDDERTSWTEVDRARLVARMVDGEVARFHRPPVVVDIFVPSIPFYAEAERTLRSAELVPGRRVNVLSAEALCVFKLLFFRDKDLVDLRRLVRVQGAALDHAWVREHLVDMFPDGDERLGAWDEIVRRHGPPPA